MMHQLHPCQNPRHVHRLRARFKPRALAQALDMSLTGDYSHINEANTLLAELGVCVRLAPAMFWDAGAPLLDDELLAGLCCTGSQLCVLQCCLVCPVSV